MATVIGKNEWVIAGGQIPLFSTGDEPRFTSRDTLCVLNTSLQDAVIRIQVYHTVEPPTKSYVFEVKAQRVRRVRINDLIDPLPVMLDTPYALLIESNMPVVVQFSRMNTGQRELASFIANAFPAEK